CGDTGRGEEADGQAGKERDRGRDPRLTRSARSQHAPLVPAPTLPRSAGTGGPVARGAARAGRVARGNPGLPAPPATRAIPRASAPPSRDQRLPGGGPCGGDATRVPVRSRQAGTGARGGRHRGRDRATRVRTRAPPAETGTAQPPASRRTGHRGPARDPPPVPPLSRQPPRGMGAPRRRPPVTGARGGCAGPRASYTPLHDGFPPLVSATGPVLAAGLAGTGAVAGGLAGLAAVPAGGDHLRRAVRLAEGAALPAGPRVGLAARGCRYLRAPAWRPGIATSSKRWPTGSWGRTSSTSNSSGRSSSTASVRAACSGS